MNELTYDEYERLSMGGALVPVFREIPGDLKTPVSAFLSLAARSERAFLLESVVGGSAWRATPSSGAIRSRPSSCAATAWW